MVDVSGILGISQNGVAEMVLSLGLFTALAGPAVARIIDALTARAVVMRTLPARAQEPAEGGSPATPPSIGEHLSIH